MSRKDGRPKTLPQPGFASEPHRWPCDFFFSQNWTGGGYSGKPLLRKSGKYCTCAVDASVEEEDVD